MLNDYIDAAVAKKVSLLNTELPRYCVRSVLAGVYLTLGTAFSAVMGQRVETLAPGLGVPVFAMFFFIGLATIVMLGAELVTGNMMYTIFAMIRGSIDAKNTAKLLAVCTLGNLVGAVVVGAALSQAHIFADITDQSLVSGILTAKLSKPAYGIFIEAIIANFVVNMGMMGTMLLKDFTAKFIMLMFVIGMFVGLGTDHVIANFSLVSIVGFASHPLPASFTAGNIAINWIFAWLGNFVGGGLLMGATYGWLNKSSTVYHD